MSKEKFKYFIDFIQKRRELMEDITECTKQFDLDFNFVDSDYESKLIELLEIEMDDDDKFISYFIYELDFGRKGDLFTINGEEIQLLTAEDLYDFLMGVE